MATPATRLRIGDLAERAGVTPRTVRYYEELGLLPQDEREQGKHRTYDETAVERLRQLGRLRDLLGLSLEELKRVIEGEDARAELKRKWDETESREVRLRIVEAASANVELQLELVRRRMGELQALEADLSERRKLIQRRRRELTS